MAGPIGPRGLRKGASPGGTMDARRALIRHAIEICEGDLVAAIGLLSGCALELAFVVADDAGPPEHTRAKEGHWARGAWATAIGDTVFQPAARLLVVVSAAFSEESSNFKNWSGEYLALVQSRLEQHAYLFGVELSQRLASVELRGPERDGEPLSQAEFEDALFERRVREIHGRALRCQPAGFLGGLELAFAVYVEFLLDIARSDVQKAVALASEASSELQAAADRLRGSGEPAQPTVAESPSTEPR